MVDWLKRSPTSGKGEGTISFEADPNEGCDRSYVVSVRTPASGLSVLRTVTVTQSGRREPFSGSDTGFELSDGGTFNVLKSNQ